MAGLAHRIVRHDIEQQILRAVVGQLVRLAGFENEGVARFNRRRPRLMPDDAPAGNHMVKFPLRAVRMIRTGRLPQREAANLDIKRMPLHQVRGLRLASQRLGNFLARTRELSLGRFPGKLLQLVGVDFLHS